MERGGEGRRGEERGGESGEGGERGTAPGDTAAAALVLPASGIDGPTLYLAAFFHTTAQMLNGEFGLGGDPQFAHEYLLVLLASLTGFYWQALIVASLTTALERAGRSSSQ